MPRQEIHNEQELLQQIAVGSEAAFAEIFYRYHQQLGAFIYQLTASKDLAEEVVQDVFLKIWENRQALSEVTHFRSWLFTISRNHTFNALKKMLRERMQQSEWGKLQGHALAAETDNLEEHYQLIDQAINQLPPQQKKVFLLSRYKRLKYEEIAKELNLSRETVKYYLKTANHAISKFVSSHHLLVLCWLLQKIIC